MKIQDLLTDETRWCKGFSARDCDGNPCGSQESVAVRWCLQGAVRKTYGSYFQSAIGHDIAQHVGKSVSVWNDAPERTFSEVRELIEKLDI